MGALNLRRGRSAGRECLSKPDPRKNLHSRRGIERISMIDANGDFEQLPVLEGNALRPNCLYRISREQ